MPTVATELAQTVRSSLEQRAATACRYQQCEDSISEVKVILTQTATVTLRCDESEVENDDD